MNISIKLHGWSWQKLHKNSKYTHYMGGRTNVMYKLKKK